MLHRVAAVLFAVSALVGPAVVREADACGIKLTIKTPKRVSMRARTPTRAMGDRPVVAAQPDRKPIAAGPAKPASRTLVARGTEPAPTPASAPAPKPAPAPTPAPTPAPPPAPPVETVAAAQPRPTPEPAETKPAETKPVKPADVFKRSEVYFGVGHAEVSAPMKRSLARTARYLANNADARIVVEGHADPTGQAEKNLELSEQRAEAVRDHLVSTGVDSSRIEVKAFGDTQLKYGRRDGRNRRVLVDLAK